MRMGNPFSNSPGDEEEHDADASQDPLDPGTDEAIEETPEPEPAEAYADEETAESEPYEEEAPKKKKGSEHHLLHEGEFTAPSVGPHTVIDRPPPEERLNLDQISDTDAMGKQKRREVVGGTYGPTRARVFATFATFFAVVAAVAVGFYFLAKELDQPPDENADVAPWSAADAPQQPPKPLQ